MKKAFVTEFVQDCGLGNQLFEWATGHAISKRLGLPHYWVFLPSGHRKYGLDAFGIHENPPPSPYKLVMAKKGQGSKRLLELAVRLVEGAGSAFPAVSCPFQDEECFKEVADEIRSKFKVPPLNLHVPRGTTPVGVQVRMGDYAKHPRLDVVTPAYFAHAMERMKELVDNPHFFFTSDDLNWCRENFGDRKDVTVLPPHNEFAGLRMMVACKAHIISNSTFGWWGAWLGEDGPVIAPDKWHMGPGSYGDWEPVPKRWLRVGGTKVDRTPNQIDVREFKELDALPSLDRCIVYPWKEGAAKWHELRFSLRSIHKFFEDKECPIYILGDQRPGFLLYNEHRVKYINTWSYSEALNNGVQLAKKCLWMNDDIFLLKPTTWGDVSVPLHLGEIAEDFLDKVPPQPNAWRAGAVRALKALRDKGITEHRVYSTHTPYVYQRTKAMDLLEEFGVWEKMCLEILYFHHFPEGSRKITDEKAVDENFGDARYLNLVDTTLTPAVKEALMALLPDFAPWELARKFPV